MIAIVGGGPAGLRAAEVARQSGLPVTVFDAQPSVGRKFLVAGSGGLNLTKAEEPARFAVRFRGGKAMPEQFWPRQIAAFGPAELRAWAAELGIETFAASTGRVYPREMKAAPLLRAWVRRLRGSGVRFAVRHRLTRLQGTNLHFGSEVVRASAVVLALGGGSWPQTGSDGAWTSWLRSAGIEVAPLEPANCGWEVDWPARMADFAGKPLKNVRVFAGSHEAAGELMITSYGLEGGAIYALGAALRGMAVPEITIDLKPDVGIDRLIARFGTVGARLPQGEALAREAAARWRLDAGAAALLAMGNYHAVTELAQAAKACRVRLRAPRPLAEAISSAGGVSWEELDERLMLRRMPGVFVAGEMIDWEAPTGGYLMQGAFVTGGIAGAAAAEWAGKQLPITT